MTSTLDEFQRSVISVYPELLRFFRKRAPREADDLASETVLAVWAGRDRFRGDASVRTYAFRVAYRVLMRRRGRREPQDHDASDITEDMLSNLPALHADLDCWGVFALPHALAVLDARYRELLLAYAAGRTHRELAELFRLPPGSVSRNLRSAAEALRRAFAAVASTNSRRRELSADDREAWDRLLEQCEHLLGTSGGVFGDRANSPSCSD